MIEASEGSAAMDASQGGPSAGQLVRQAREAAGLEVDGLAAALKVTVKQIEALEADRWDQLPDLAFARALAASVCRILKVDAAPVLARLPLAGPRLSPRGEGLNQPFKTPQRRSTPDIGAHLSRPVVLGVLALLMGALVLVLMPVPQESPQNVLPAATEQARTPAPQAAAPASAPAGLVTELVTPANPPAASASAPAALPAATPLPQPAPVAAAPAAPPAPAASAPASLLGFNASADSWIKVTDARGTVVLSRLLKPGESAAAAGALPLSVVVGRADATRVQLRGQPMDLTPITRENVARFEVK